MTLRLDVASFDIIGRHCACQWIDGLERGNAVQGGYTGAVAVPVCYNLVQPSEASASSRVLRVTMESNDSMLGPIYVYRLQGKCGAWVSSVAETMWFDVDVGEVQQLNVHRTELNIREDPSE